MKIAHFDCFSGISGDMILGALIDAGLNPNLLIKELSKLSIEGLSIDTHYAMRKSISCKQVRVKIGNKNIDFEDEHLLQLPIDKKDRNSKKKNSTKQISSGHNKFSHPDNIINFLQKSDLKPNVRKKSIAIFQRLIDAEASVHGCDSNDVHLHEVGTIDAIVDVVGSVIGLDLLQIDQVFSSPLCLGTGFVSCAHGRYPVPVPGVLELCKNVPCIQTDIRAELVTPTGAAIITTLACSFDSLPVFHQKAIGYGAGSRDLKEQPNVLRVRLGELSAKVSKEKLVHIEANIDDMNPEVFSYLFEILFENGARDVFLTPIIMKRSRPGQLLGVLVDETLLSKTIQIILSETTTLGVRYNNVDRYLISREIVTVNTIYGKIRVKVGNHNDKKYFAPEYEDCANQAKRHKTPLRTIYEAAKKAAAED